MDIRDALIDPTGRYRYWLARGWQDPGAADFGGIALWIMLNPSTADAQKDDPTIRRVVQFTKRWGYGRAVVANLFAFRATSPLDIPVDEAEAIGAGCNLYIRTLIRGARLVVAAWGSPASPRLSAMMRPRVALVRELAREAGVTLHAIGVTHAGAPKHPLARGLHRVPDDALPVPWGAP